MGKTVIPSSYKHVPSYPRKLNCLNGFFCHEDRLDRRSSLLAPVTKSDQVKVSGAVEVSVHEPPS